MSDLHIAATAAELRQAVKELNSLTARLIREGCTVEMRVLEVSLLGHKEMVPTITMEIYRTKTEKF